jgi:O-antigen ligase
VIVIAFVATLAGHFTLTRIGLEIPVLNDTRVLLFAAMLMAFALEMKAAGHRPSTGAAARGLHPVLLLIVYQMFSAAWAPRGAIINDVLSDLIAETILLCVYTALAEWDGDRVLRVTMGCVYAAAGLYFLYAASGRGHTASDRWAAFGGGPNVFVRVMALGILAAAYFYFRSGDRLVWLIGVPPFLIGALASGSRGGLSALGITTAVALPRLVPFFRSGRFLRPLAALAALCAATWAVIGDMIIALANNRFFAATLQQRYTSDRDILYEKGFGLFVEKPVFGVGVHGFYAITNLGPGERYVHNLPLAVAAEGGVVGLILLLAAFYGLRREFARVPYRKRSIESRAAAYAGIYVGCAGLFSGDYYDARLMWIFLLLASVRPAPPPQSPRPVRQEADRETRAKRRVHQLTETCSNETQATP